MTVKELAAGVVLFAGAVTGGVTIVGGVHSYFMNAIHAVRLDARIYHLESEIIELQGVSALYQARLQDNGELTSADSARHSTILSKIQAAREAKRLLEQELAGL